MAGELGNPIGSLGLVNNANTNITNGVYRVATGSGTSANLPVTSAYGVLLVFAEKQSDAITYGAQLFVSVTSSDAFVRGYRVSGGVMTENSGWKKITP